MYQVLHILFQLLGLLIVGQRMGRVAWKRKPIDFEPAVTTGNQCAEYRFARWQRSR
ncbi:hypothetical protein [Nocardia veterana]|uniref:Uncharacterized protein n=1 Tax=Nocardia veterana TaxID=132249 RepID=A0A7X6M5A7_9NOCA|nr:hypothetical protein [Nocardia veterana]NKY89620.1 hypothetical protein [Nocardia veterana]